MTGPLCTHTYPTPILLHSAGITILGYNTRVLPWYITLAQRTMAVTRVTLITLFLRDNVMDYFKRARK